MGAFHKIKTPLMKMANQHQHGYAANETNLFCSEEHWEEQVGGDEFEDQHSEYPTSNSNNNNSGCSIMIKSHDLLLESDMFWEEQELTWLLGKEEHNPLSSCLQGNPALESARIEAVEWILKVNAHYSFSTLTPLLAVNYFDRFLFSYFSRSHSHSHNVIPWMTHLAAVACLSLAAKVDETQVPLLLHLQVEDSGYLFQCKTIHRMEILVLSTLGWKMNPPTPLSFLDYVTRRLGSKKDHLCWEFLGKSQALLLSILPDSRFMSYLPSELATATMMHVVKSVEPGLEAEYKSQLFGILGMDKEKVNECCKVMLELWSGYEEQGKQRCMKRKFRYVPGSPNGVMDVSFGNDCSNDSWEVSKKSRTQEQLLLPNAS